MKVRRFVVKRRKRTVQEALERRACSAPIPILFVVTMYAAALIPESMRKLRDLIVGDQSSRFHL